MADKTPHDKLDLSDCPVKDTRDAVRRRLTRRRVDRIALFRSTEERDARFPALAFIRRHGDYCDRLPRRQLRKLIAKGEREKQELLGMFDDVENGRPRRP
ncbi:hypothetical protein KIPB_000370 [Kipferlia bialata]|uniref:Uncharacterized protein n=1 Tax=Kipferlia bialata TaxID=797122 RepID=A0A9K3GEG0_9EUKA|nr:hypothetical protein KIPB_000370 [Kipferlia bialata]|eukprot:g370.t1